MHVFWPPWQLPVNQQEYEPEPLYLPLESPWTDLPAPEESSDEPKGGRVIIIEMFPEE